MKHLLLLLAFFAVFNSKAQTCVGKWVTIDDQSGRKSSMVELYKVDGKLYGNLTFLFPKEGREENPKCTKCTDDRKDQPWIGMQIIRGLKWDGSTWGDGKFIDPGTGKIYTLKLWLVPGNSNYLNVRGYIGPFFRTQKWVRVE